ncbi:winged helix-turn-helix domain-containing protein [Oscillochloris sp. ZM17-4]|uniref:winged helix-turn-helix domain-containing protein n=1 Tax=Oscillochloris sp. ZM17-4 TaxID=2866714 RepID=UPI002106BA2B|nr:crosslink repair DNA glycosylase YcaQ family protein [Oscillochloris sp. ZM17-4]
MKITPEAARHMLLAAQGLLTPPGAPAGKADVLAAIRRMGALQIDTIHIVARSPYLVLWARLGQYEPAWLDELLAEGALFEYWAHAACFLPVEDYRLFRRRMLSQRVEQDSAYQWARAHPEATEAALARVRAEGPLRVADFDGKGGGGGWWDHKPAKTALECLFDLGHLMIARRERFHRVYDLSERVLPGWDDADTPGADAVRRELLLRGVRALGVAPARWVHDYYRQKDKRACMAELAKLAEAGALLSVEVEGWGEPALVHPDNLGLLEQAAAGALTPTVTTLLSPFDPVVWDRERAHELFGFFYRIEVYTPAAKRAYGYFTLPILHRGRLVGRLDPKAHRAEGIFEVKAVHLEPGVQPDDELVAGLAGALRGCAAWHGTPEVIVGKSDPPELAGALQRALG